ncbi:RNA polymerase sigma factor [Mameliella sediminis]|uniref:RNA polymerase sigma factor n=1 Tax=Mameliella sediminis TaxID=2836866 RepID=UPI001C478DC9|nr:sigma-70 family RNA polymerase sigma factor [Mameliella sediminis]MBV7392691.1 sigma-70 family RNA polymerase sigma factor [Mameliella sediminis]MBY6114828.1 sigma-70 family RNA polymerase sigma factor [Antarctobacter heliothermus]MBY6144401.1 sigma-70 family RNA polymerase sigma factor [Mameliella alba]MCA0954450.1 sigma-70 family RNA polymerase sigma factor [Mameliella alba]
MGGREELERRLSDYVKSLRRYALVLTRDGDAAEDLVQETLTKAIAASDSWQPGSDMRVWLFRILHNTHVSDMRRVRVRENAKLMLPEPVEETDPTKRLELQQVLDALEELPEPQRLPIVLVALKEMSYADAAQTLNVPLGTFYSRLARGREALRKIMAGVKSTKLKLVV